jgi:hypothetical protein
MRRRLLLVAAVLPLAACSTGTPGTPVAGPLQPANTTAAATTTATTAAIQHGHDAGAKLTAACPLLTADELTQLLGGHATKLTATEAGVDGDSASPIYSCRYGADGKHPFETSVGKIDTTGITFSAKDAVDAFAGEGSGVHRLDGIGEDAVFLKLSDGTAFAATATHTHGELRTATFAAPGIVPQQVMATVLKTLAGRL